MPPNGATQQGVTQIIIQGDVFSSERTAAWLIETLRDEIENKDTVIINPQSNSTQAQVLMG